MHDHIQNDDHDEADGEAADGGQAQPLDRGGEDIDHLAARDQQCKAPQHVLHAQGGHEWMRQMQAGQQRAVDEADHTAGHDANDHQDDAAAHTGLGQSTHQAGAEHRVGAHGQVNAGGDQAQKHTDRQEGVERGLLQNAHQVRIAVKVLIGDRQEQAHDHQCQDGAQLKAGALLFLSHLNFLPMPLS